MQVHKRPTFRRHCLAVALATGLIGAAHAFPGTPAPVAPSAHVSTLVRAWLGNGMDCGPYVLSVHCRATPTPSPVPRFLPPVRKPSVGRVVLAL